MSERVAKWVIRPKYISMVNRYDTEKNAARKTSMKYRFKEWFINNSSLLTEAEQEYLQKSICYIED